MNDTINPTEEIVKKRRIDTMIGIPSWKGGIDPETQVCLDHLVHLNVLNGKLVCLKKASGSMIAENRNNIIWEAIEKDVKSVLFIDTDMVFPPDALQILRAFDKPVISALAFTKSPPFKPLMYNRANAGGWNPVLKWDKDELLKVDAIAGGFLLVKTSVFKKIDPPWFASPTVLEHVCHEEVDKLVNSKCKPEDVVRRVKALYKQYSPKPGTKRTVLGEDIYFSEKCRKANVPIFVDTSMRIGHMGRHCFSYADFADQVSRGVFDGISEEIGVIHGRD